MPPSPPRAVATPCVQVCIVDGQSGLCLGCFRTLSEIGGWAGFSETERAALMAGAASVKERDAAKG